MHLSTFQQKITSQKHHFLNPTKKFEKRSKTNSFASNPRELKTILGKRAKDQHNGKEKKTK